MLFEPLLERFAQGTPLSVMTRALLENALQPEPLDQLFERLAVKQYTRELLFSTVVQTMALVACRPAVPGVNSVQNKCARIASVFSSRSCSPN